MSNDLVVGSIRSTANPPLTGGIYEALLEKAQRENEEQARLLGMGSEREARLITERDEALKEKERWGLYAEKIERERDHYKQALEEISTTIQEWLDSMVQEPAEDFIHAIKAWADKKLNNL